MNPFFFGSADSPLYGVMHPAEGAHFRNECVVLCNPFGQEYERAHRAFRIIANNLSRLGYEVLRFDFSGTGDSGGAGESISLARWSDDIVTAIDEVKDCSGADIINLVGLRLGASLALSLSSRVKGLNRCVCWDPIVDGQTFFDEITRYLEPEYVPVLLTPESEVYLNGYPLPWAFRKELVEFSIANIKLGDAKYIMLSSHENPLYVRTYEALALQAESLVHKVVACESDWNYVDEFGGILIPQPIISAITEIFS